MWEEIEKDIKLYDECNYLHLDQDAILGIGDKKSNIIIVFDKISHSMKESNSIIRSVEYNKLKIILDFINVDINNCYVTCLNKYYNKMQDISYDDRKYAMSIFLKELYLVNPKYIICVGEDIFNYLYRYYTGKENKVDILKNVGKIFEFYNLNLIPIYDIEYIS